MILKEKERSVIEDLQTQEKSCVEKYGKYAEQARDPELKNLFRNIQQEEQKHYESLSMILSGSVPECNCNDRSGRDYQPKAVYTAMSSPEDKQHDAFLATDCIGTEKLVSGTYNDDVFAFGDSGVRKLLADIQIEEQNHAPESLHSADNDFHSGNNTVQVQRSRPVPDRHLHLLSEVPLRESVLLYPFLSYS